MFWTFVAFIFIFCIRITHTWNLSLIRMMNDKLLRDQCSFPMSEACTTLRWPCVWMEGFQSNKTFAFGPIAICRGSRGLVIHFVVVVLRCIRIRTNGSTPILILCFRFFVAFVIRIRITDKWNLSFVLCFRVFLGRIRIHHSHYKQVEY